MKRAVSTLLLLLVAAGTAAADREAPATQPANPLLGRWRLVFPPGHKIPADLALFWTFDQQDLVITDREGNVLSRRPYSLAAEGGHRVITIKYGSDGPDRIGWYESKGVQLRIVLTTDTGKPPERWDESKALVFAREAL
jgi:hypothetical protein